MKKLIDTPASAGGAQQYDERDEEHGGVVARRSPEPHSLGEHVVQQEKHRNARCKARDEAGDKREPDEKLAENDQGRKQSGVGHYDLFEESAIKIVRVLERKVLQEAFHSRSKASLGHQLRPCRNQKHDAEIDTQRDEECPSGTPSGPLRRRRARGAMVCSGG